MDEPFDDEATDTGDDDTALMQRLRCGDDSAYGELFRRHAPVVRRFAVSLRRPGLDVDDVLGEVFLRVLRAVRAGHGPREYVRTYLFTVVRRVVSEWTAAPRDELIEHTRLGERASEATDHQSTQAEGELLARAFGRLPPRWRAVLWHMEVEGHRPATIAAELGLTPNATAVLAHRARRGLRQAYFRAAGPPAPGCAHRRLPRREDR